MHEQTQRAARFFDGEQNYRRRAIAVTRLRTELVSEFLGRPHGKRIVDLGCGNGEISAQFIRENEVTWVDASPKMLEAGLQALDAQDRARVRALNADVMEFSADRAFDIVLVLGVLAHVPDPRAFVNRLASLARPGGLVVLQYSDHDSPFHTADKYWRRLVERIRPRYGYLPNETSSGEVGRWTSGAGLKLIDAQRFLLPPPVIRRFLSPRLAYGYAKASLRLPPLSPHAPEVLGLFERLA